MANNPRKTPYVIPPGSKKEKACIRKTCLSSKGLKIANMAKELKNSAWKGLRLHWSLREVIALEEIRENRSLLTLPKTLADIHTIKTLDTLISFGHFMMKQNY